MLSAITLTYWTWLILGLALLAVELLAPFTFFLWLGVSALVTAAVSFVAPEMNWQYQFATFALLSVLSVWLSRRYLVSRQTRSELPDLNRRAQQYIGRTFTLTEAIENGYGKISVDDTRWQVRGPALPKGAAVKATGCDGSVLVVVAVDDESA